MTLPNLRWDLLWEAVKEPLRWGWFGLWSWLITDYVVEGIVTAFAGSMLTPDQKLYVMSGLTAFLRGIDKYMHKYGQEVGNETLTKGLTFGQ